MSKKLIYDADGINNNALQMFNQAIKGLREATDCLNGIDTSGLDLQLNINGIKSKISESGSTIATIVSSIIDALNAFEQAENNDIKIVNLFKDAIEFFKNRIDDLIKRTLPGNENEEPIDIWKEGIWHQIVTDFMLKCQIFIPMTEDDESKPAIVCLTQYRDIIGKDDPLEGYDAFFIIPEELTATTVKEAVDKCLKKYNINPKQIVLVGDGDAKEIYDEINSTNDTFTFCIYRSNTDVFKQTREEFEKIFDNNNGEETVEIGDETEEETFEIETEEIAPKGWEGVAEWTSKIVKKGNQWIREKIPLIPYGFQNDDSTKATYNYGKAGSNVFKGACGLFAGCINPRSLMGGVEIALDTWLKIQRGISSGGSDGSLYGSIAQTMEFCRIYNFRKI